MSSTVPVPLRQLLIAMVAIEAASGDRYRHDLAELWAIYRRHEAWCNWWRVERHTGTAPEPLLPA